MQLLWQPGAARRGAPALIFSYTLIGPVTGIDPLEVLGQRVTITGDTVLEGFTNPAQLVLGAPMIVAGLVDPNGSLYATLAVRRGAQDNKYLLTGYSAHSNLAVGWRHTPHHLNRPQTSAASSFTDLPRCLANSCASPCVPHEYFRSC